MSNVSENCPKEAVERPRSANALAFTRGLLDENPVLRQALGMCSTLAITTAVANGIGMGLETTFVLVCSGVAVSALRKVIPDSVRIPAFITIIASFVTIVMMIIQAYLPALDEALGIYLPLIVVNCIVLGRAEAFASKHGVVESALDGLGMGVGYTIALVVMCAIRELLGAGTLLGFQVMPAAFQPILIMVTPAGGFATLGGIIGTTVWIQNRRGHAVDTSAGCGTCGEPCEFSTAQKLEEIEQAVIDARIAADEQTDGTAQTDASRQGDQKGREA